MAVSALRKNLGSKSRDSKTRIFGFNADALIALNEGPWSASEELKTDRTEQNSLLTFLLQFVISEDAKATDAAKPEINDILEIYGISLGLTKESQKVSSFSYDSLMIKHTFKLNISSVIKGSFLLCFY